MIGVRADAPGPNEGYRLIFLAYMISIGRGGPLGF